MWVIFAFASAFFAGITAILAKCGIKDTDSDVATAIRTVIVLIFSWLMVFVAGSWKTIGQADMRTFIFLILSGTATGVSWLCYFRALQLGDVNKVTPVDKTSTVLTMILAAVFLGEEVSVLKIISMVLILMGTFFMIQKKNIAKEERSGKDTGNLWFFYASASALAASLTSILGKVGIQGIDSTLGTAIRTGVVLIMAWLIVFVRGKQDTVKMIGKRSWFFLVLSGFATGASWLCYYHALQTGPASVVAPIDKLSILFTIGFSWLVYKERLGRKAASGLVMIVAGTFLLLV